MNAARPNQILRIGDFTLDPEINELARGDERQRLPSRLVDLLRRLAAEPGQMLSRETLLDQVWDRRLVNDEVLSRAIADLRQALGDDARAPRYIETVPKRGYRLLAAVSEISSDPTPTPVDAGATKSRQSRPSRRVLAWLAGIALILAIALLIARAIPGDSAIAPAADPLTPANLLRARPFTTDAGRELFPRFTPDGRWVIYARVGDDDLAASLRLRAVDGTEDRVLADGGGDNYCGSVSPDGITLAWLRVRPGVCELVHRPLLGGPAQVLAGCGTDALASCPDWSADGGRLVLGAGPDGATGLRGIAFPSGVETVLTTPPSRARDFLPRHAPGGTHLAFWRGDNWGRQLLQLDLRSADIEALRAQPQLSFGHAFATDSALLLADDSLGQRALLRLDLPVRQAPTLLGGADARHPDIARDGGIVFEVARYDANLWRIDLGDDAIGGEPRKLTESARYDSQPAVSTDGAWLAFGSNRDGREAVYMMRSDGSEERKLPLDPSLRWTSPTWSPDAAQLLVLRYTDAGAQLCIYRIAAATVACPSAFGRGLHGAFFLDEEHIGAVDAESAAPSLHRIALRDGARSVIDAPGVVDRCRATARWLACHRPARNGLWLQDRASGVVRDIVPQISAENRGAWTLTDRSVLFASSGSAEVPRGIHRYDLSGDETRRVSAFWPSAIGDTVSVAPDESFLILARTDALETDLVYVPPPLVDQP